MSDLEGRYRRFLLSSCQCTGTTVIGGPCRATVSRVKLADFWPGVSDRCVHHVDGLERRSRTIAAIAGSSGAGGFETLETSLRLDRTATAAMLARGFRHWHEREDEP
jgi:hypothetical protein